MDGTSVKTVNGEGKSGKFPLTAWEVVAASGVVLGFVFGLAGVYLTLPASDYSFLKLPRSLQDIQILKDNLESYTSDYTIQVLVGYCLVYIFMQTFPAVWFPTGLLACWFTKLELFGLWLECM